MPAKADKPADKKSVFDVTKPGKAAPDASARPIVVNRQPVLQDPMVRDTESLTEKVPGPPVLDGHNAEVKKMLNPSSHKIIISPTGELHHDNDTSDKPKPAEGTPIAQLAKRHQTVTEKDHSEESDKKESISDKDNKELAKPEESETPKEEPIDEAQPNKESEEKDQEKAETSEESGDENIVDEMAKQAATKKQKEAESKEAAVQNEKFQKLITNKTYFLPIGQVTRRRNTRRLLLILLLLLLLGIAAADLAIDAGIVKTNVKPLTHFFKPQS